MKYKCKENKSLLKAIIMLGGVFLLAVWLVKPIGVSTQFVIADAIVWDAVTPSLITEDAAAKSGYVSTNEYLNKSGGKYAKSVSNPLNYSYVFVFAMLAGAWISSKLRGGQTQEENTMPKVWRDNYGNNKTKRYIVAFLSGVLVLYGARLAGGCTSGHMMSGIMQTSLSGYLFAAGAFAAGIPTAILVFRKKEK
tara:strand:+ start:127056 stop:127637 length:582 start_codon:yes stop_codon:yes gene_type:complete